jgi:hypothetical protein
MAAADDAKYFVSKAYTIICVILVLVVLYITPVYPEMLVRVLFGFMIFAAGFFGFASDEQHCDLFYRKLKLPCMPRWFNVYILSTGIMYITLWLAYQIYM